MNIKWYIQSALLIFLVQSSLILTNSKTFFRPRSIIETDSIFFAQNNYNNYRTYFNSADDDAQTSTRHLYAGVFYQHSQKPKKLASYFLPCNKNSITIREDGSGDVGSLWLSVIAPDSKLYSSCLSLCPKQQLVGAYANYWQSFGCHDQFWFDLRCAWYQSEHNLHPKEHLLSEEGTLANAATALEYLQSDNFKYGKISNCSLKRKGFDDIELKLGYIAFGDCEEGHLDLYGSFLIPVGKKPTAKFVFEPLVGRRHGAAGLGLNGGYPCWQWRNTSFVFMGDLSYQYLFKAHELRSFDLCANGDWSRYLRVVNQATPGISYPAINFLTTKVDVTPRSVVTLWAAFHAQHNCWHAEVGYNFWWKQSEKICLGKGKKCLADLSELGIFDLANTCNPTSASTATINQSKTLNGTSSNDVVSDATFQTLSVSDLNINSAAHPHSLSNTIYASLAYDATVRNHMVNMALSGSYEFAHGRNAIEQFGLWFTGNVNF